MQITLIHCPSNGTPVALAHGGLDEVLSRLRFHIDNNHLCDGLYFLNPYSDADMLNSDFGTADKGQPC